MTKPTVSKQWRKIGPPHRDHNDTTTMQYAQWNGPSETKPNPENCKNCSSKCAYDCAQLQYTIQHSTTTTTTTTAAAVTLLLLLWQPLSSPLPLPQPQKDHSDLYFLGFLLDPLFSSHFLSGRLQLLQLLQLYTLATKISRRLHWYKKLQWGALTVYDLHEMAYFLTHPLLNNYRTHCAWRQPTIAFNLYVIKIYGK